MPSTIDDIMELASQSLAQTDYFSCDVFCTQALADAHKQEDWANYARILLPLQEARRQRRMRAADGTIQLGTTDLETSLNAWLMAIDHGCIAISHPHQVEDATALDKAARAQRRCVEVLFADNEPTQSSWTLRSLTGPPVNCSFPSPPDPPGDWFLDAGEVLGNAALRGGEAPLGDRHRIDQLEQMLQAVPHHEILLQQLGDAARAMCC